MTPVRWPDQHPRTKPHACVYCDQPARLFPSGPRCDEHSPAAMRKAVAS